MSKFYEKILRPILFRLPTETVHEVGISALKIGLGSDIGQRAARKRFLCDGFGDIERFGLKFANPIGMAAGFDKNGVVVNQLGSLGFGFVEVGTVTFDPQSGNEKPRLFRLPQDKALINRLGFNNEGTPKVIARLEKLEPNCVLGINIGKNKNVPNDEAIENYLKSFDLAFEVGDYIAVNVSSPNTPNLRKLQKSDVLEELLGEIQKRNHELSKKINQTAKPLLVKIAPDLNESEIEAITGIAMDLKISGIIATNTTISREGLTSDSAIIGKAGDGGLSGKPVYKRSNEVISMIHQYSQGKLPIIGVGGVFSATDAFEKIAAGACLLEAYTGFIYQGITFARELNFGLLKILKEKGYNSLDEAVGSMVK